MKSSSLAGGDDSPPGSGISRGLSVGAYKNNGFRWENTVDPNPNPYNKGSNYGNLAPVAAPGWHIYTTWYDYSGGTYDFKVDWAYRVKEVGGTSFAAPYAAGLALLLAERDPSATAMQVVDAIRDGAVPLYWYNNPRDPNQGTGANEELPLRIDYIGAMNFFDQRPRL